MGSGATTLAMAQQYADDVADALSAAAQVYLTMHGSNAALVNQLVAGLQAAKAALDSATAASDARSIAMELVSFIQQLLPLVTQYLGSAAPYVPSAIAVIQTFINLLPPPANAPVVPPAALHTAAMKYKYK